MKKWLCLLILLLPLTAFAEEQLYAAMDENGLWGYINAQAEWVIAPQYDGASGFRGDYAVAWILPEGLIRRTGMTLTVRASLTAAATGWFCRNTPSMAAKAATGLVARTRASGW